MLSDLYETEYGIYNHLAASKDKPLASVAFHECEDVNTNSLLEERMRTYISKGIGSLYRLSFIEFLEIPHDIMEMLLAVTEEESSRKARALLDIEKEFNK